MLLFGAFDAELPWPLISNVCAPAKLLASSAQHAMNHEILPDILGPSEKILQFRLQPALMPIGLQRLDMRVDAAFPLRPKS